MAFTPINTQDEFDAAIKERIERAERNTETKVRAEFAGFISPEKIKEQTDAINAKLKEATDKNTENEKKLNEANGKIKAYETASVKRKIADELKIPAAFADRLNGENEEDIRKDAEVLAKSLGDSYKAPAYNPEQGESKKDGDNAAYKNMLKDLTKE